MADPKKELRPAKMAKEEPAAAPPPAKAKMPLMIAMIGGIVTLQVVLTVVAIQWLKPGDPEMIAAKAQKILEERERAQQTEMGRTSEPISIIVNLAGKDSERFLKTELVLEYNSAKEETIKPMIDERKPKLKDIAIGVLTSCTYDDVKDREGKKKVLERLRAEMNKIFPEPDAVTNVLFDGFVVQ